MASFIFAALMFAFGYGLGRYGWGNIKAWFLGLAASIAAGWESVEAFIAGFMG